MKISLRRKIVASAGAVGLLLLAASGPTDAQTASGATAVTQSPYHPDGSNIFTGQTNGATSCNAVSQTSASDTITLTPTGSNYVVLDGIYILNSTDATGVTQVPTISFTNINTGGFPAILSAASALTTVQGVPPPMTISFGPFGLKANTPGTAVTIVPSATQSAHNILCMAAWWHQSPQ